MTRILMPRRHRTTYICQLERIVQEAIQKELQKVLPAEEVELAMSGRVCDLEDTIKFKYTNPRCQENYGYNELSISAQENAIHDYKNNFAPYDEDLEEATKKDIVEAIIENKCIFTKLGELV